jgi:hypothetical protein
MADSKVSQMKYSRRLKGLIKRKSSKNLKATSPKLRRRSTTSIILMSQGGSRNSQPERSWRSHPPPPEYLKWSEVPITFDRSDHPDFIRKPGQYPLIVCPIIKDVKLNRILMDGGSSLNILFLKTFDQMGLSRSLMCPSRAPFHGIVHSAATTPVTFMTQENFRTETIQFEVTDFETVYNNFCGRLALSKFMAIPHYAYLILKMPGSCGVISIRGDIKRAFDCDRESCETANRLQASAEL